MVLGEDTISCSVKNCDTTVHMKCSQTYLYSKRGTENTSGILDTDYAQWNFSLISVAQRVASDWSTNLSLIFANCVSTEYEAYFQP